MEISIIGTGYVGLVTGVCLASFGHQVVGVEIDKEKREKIGRGEPPFFEPRLKPLLRRMLQEKRFQITADLEKAILNSQVSLITVATPTVNNQIDL